MLVVKLVNLRFGDEVEFNDLEELVAHIEEEINAYRAVDMDIAEIMNGRHYEYGVEWEMKKD